MAQKQDPYCGFKSDLERRRALNFRALCFTVAAVALAPLEPRYIQMLIGLFL